MLVGNPEKIGKIKDHKSIVMGQVQNEWVCFVDSNSVNIYYFYENFVV